MFVFVGLSVCLPLPRPEYACMCMCKSLNAAPEHAKISACTHPKGNIILVDKSREHDFAYFFVRIIVICDDEFIA